MAVLNLFSLQNKNYSNWPSLILRLAMGAGFLVHGLAKLQKGPDAFANLLAFLNVPFPHFSAWLVTLTEIFGGTALLVGLFVSVIAIPLTITMIVAMLIIHIQYGFSSIKTIGLNEQGPLFGPPGYELNIVYIAGLISLVMMGAGKFSIDALIAGKSHRHK